MRRLDLVVGPNGAGKSTFVEQRLAPLLPGSVFVNADVIARTDHATVYGNTAADVTRFVARFVDGDPVGDVTWPTWTPEALTRLDSDRWTGGRG